MNDKPSWLPECVSTDGAWNDILNRLYEIFHRDIVLGRPRFGNLEVWWDRRTEMGDCYEEGFWHLITKVDKDSGDRLLDSRRAARLPWCAPTITNADDGNVAVWDYKEGTGGIRTYLWLTNWDYVIVLEKRVMRRGEVAFLVTAFYVEGPRRRRALERKHKNRMA